MKADKVRAQDTAELENQLRDSQEQMFRLKFQIGMGQTEGVKKYRELRRDRARMLGVIRERELDPVKAAEAEKAAAAATKKSRGKSAKKGK
jgi:large subunit ribosomal protein L29